MNYETEIQSILSDIDYSVIRPLNFSVNNETQSTVNELYIPFLRYGNNKQNLNEALKLLENYEYIKDKSQIKRGVAIRYISKGIFRLESF